LLDVLTTLDELWDATAAGLEVLHLVVHLNLWSLYLNLFWDGSLILIVHLEFRVLSDDGSEYLIVELGEATSEELSANLWCKFANAIDAFISSKELGDAG